jgi:hypothetical protein
MPNITAIALSPITVPVGSSYRTDYRVSGSAWDSDTLDSIQLVQVKIDDGAWVNATDEKIGDNANWSTWGYEINTSALPNGDHTVYARAFDIDDQHDTYKSISIEYKITMKVNNPVSTTSIVSGIPDLTTNPNATVSGIVVLKGISEAPPGKTIQKLTITINVKVGGIEEWQKEVERLTKEGKYDELMKKTQEQITKMLQSGASIEGQEIAIIEWVIIENGTVKPEFASMVNVTKDNSGNITKVAWTVNWNTANTTEGNHTFNVNVFDGVNWNNETKKQLNVARPIQVQVQDYTLMIILVAVIAVAGTAGGGFAYMRKKKKATEEESPYMTEGGPELEGEMPYKAEGEFEIEEAPYTLETTPTAGGESPYEEDNIEWG